MKLYYSPGACSLAPHIALREAGIKFELEQVDLGKKVTKSGADFLKINPKGYVPTLALDDGSILTEVATLQQYIADQNAGANLLPRSGIERYRGLEWLTFISTELHKGFSPLWYPTTPDSYKATVKEKLGTRFALLDAHLAKNEYLMGKQFTVADAYCFTIVNWANFQKMSLDAWPNLKAYMARVGARPQVQAALKAEGLVN
jgi:glutathione S-transferase